MGLEIKFDADTFWKREKAYFFQVGTQHVAAVIPTGETALVLEYWEVLDGENKGQHQHGLSFMDKTQTENFMKFSNAVDGFLAHKAEQAAQGETECSEENSNESKS